MSPRLLLPDLAGLTVVVLGDFVADEYLFGQTDRVSREAPVPIVEFERSELKLGAAANVAHNLRALGVKVRAVGALGADPAGRALKRACKAVGMDVTGLLPLPGVQTSVKTRILAGALHTTRQQLLRLDRGSRVGAEHAPALLAALTAAVRNADALIISDYGAGSAGAWAGAAAASLARRLPVCVDSRFHLATFRGVTVAKPNTPELVALARPRAPKPVGQAELRTLAHRVLRAQRLEALLVTRGRDGLALYRRGQGPLELDVFGAREAVDVTGAGDTVLAAFTALLARTSDLGYAAAVANVAGGLVVQKPGTAVVTIAELAAALTSLPVA